MALSAEVIEQLDAFVSSNEQVVRYSEQTMPELCGGTETGRDAIRIYVDSKRAEAQLRSTDLLPTQLAGLAVDVVAVGRPERQSTGAPPGLADGVEINPKTRIRPLTGGISVGRLSPSKTGTLGYFVKRNDGGTSLDAVGQIVVAVDDRDAGVDAAAAKIADRVGVALTINDIGAIAGTTTA